MMSPRRSSRARTTGPAPHQTNSSSNSSNSQNRTERSTRSNNKRETSSTQRSESRDESTNGQADTLASRRSRRGIDYDNDDSVKTSIDDDDEEEEVEAEEVTRCVCGFAEYPGPPAAAREAAQRAAKAGLKEETGSQPGPEGIADDSGNFFIQCDKCQVWQHGGCVGLMDETMSPDEYFCEQCKPSLHKIIRGANGSKSTRYLPVLEAQSSRSSSTSSSEVARRKEAKQRAKEASTRRRATMNSRDAAYDEEEMLRRAIEESKSTSGTLGKRGREESEEKSNTAKRVRTSSASPELKPSPSPSQQLSDDEDDSKLTNGASRKARAATARTQREKETREKQKELEKQKKEEAAGRRNARSERRRGEDTPPPTPSLSPSKQETKATSISSTQKPSQPDTPSSHRPMTNNNHRKTGRPPARRGRIRNQLGREVNLNGEDSPSRDTPGDGHGSPSTINGGMNGESGRPSRPKYLNPNRTSLNEMKRRVAGIIEFVSRLQTEQGGSSSDGSSNSPNGSGPNGERASNPASLVKGVEAGLAAQRNGAKGKKSFRELSAKEMMEELMNGAVHWQSSFGKYGEK